MQTNRLAGDLASKGVCDSVNWPGSVKGKSKSKCCRCSLFKQVYRSVDVYHERKKVFQWKCYITHKITPSTKKNKLLIFFPFVLNLKGLFLRIHFWMKCHNSRFYFKKDEFKKTEWRTDFKFEMFWMTIFFMGHSKRQGLG